LIRGPLNSYRRNLVRRAFDKLDKDKTGKLDINDLKGVYHTEDHPDVKSGKKTSDEVLEEFLETFETHHNIISGKPKDRIIEFDEFLEYYT